VIPKGSGAETSYFGSEKWARFADGLKTLEEAVAIRRKVLLSLELAETAQSEEERRRLLTFVLIGAGPTGVEMAAIADLAKHMLARDFRHIESGMICVILLEAWIRSCRAIRAILRPSPRKSSRKWASMSARTPRSKTLMKRVSSPAETGSPSRTIIWSAGVKATPVADWLGTEADKKGLVKVQPNLSLAGRAEVFVIGDAALALDEEGRPLPGLAAVAKQQGSFVARVILDRTGGRERSPVFRYRDWGALATMGKASAVANFGRLRLRGFVAWIVWGLVHIWYLIGFRNRVRVLFNWVWLYATFSPGARLITGDFKWSELGVRESSEAKPR
jgi:NADH dehydrogenase